MFSNKNNKTQNGNTNPLKRKQDRDLRQNVKEWMKKVYEILSPQLVALNIDGLKELAVSDAEKFGLLSMPAEWRNEQHGRLWLSYKGKILLFDRHFGFVKEDDFKAFSGERKRKKSHVMEIPFSEEEAEAMTLTRGERNIIIACVLDKKNKDQQLKKLEDNSYSRILTKLNNSNRVFHYEPIKSTVVSSSSISDASLLLSFASQAVEIGSEPGDFPKNDFNNDQLALPIDEELGLDIDFLDDSKQWNQGIISSPSSSFAHVSNSSIFLYEEQHQEGEPLLREGLSLRLG